MARPAHILPVIVLAQLAGTSVWFAGNAVLPDLAPLWGEGSQASSIAWITGAVQAGFIVGTLGSAISGLADRVSPRWLFVSCALAAALANAAVLLFPSSFWGVVALRFLTGVALAGIYPIGMKIAAGWYAEGLGGALGWLVGALVVGTSIPHGLRVVGAGLPWTWVLVGTSVLCAAGGVLLARFVPDGPHLRPAGRLDAAAAWDLIRRPRLRAAALGYLGHMWELYTLWALLPAILATGMSPVWSSLWACLAIAVGGVSCVLGGLLSRRVGSRWVALVSLGVSGSCALAAPLVLGASPWVLVPFLLLWGAAVIPDSPQLSALTAQAAPPERVGSALTLLNSSGFALTIVSVQVASLLPLAWALPLLAVGPAVGGVALMVLGRPRSAEQHAAEGAVS